MLNEGGNIYTVNTLSIVILVLKIRKSYMLLAFLKKFNEKNNRYQFLVINKNVDWHTVNDIIYFIYVNKNII